MNIIHTQHLFRVDLDSSPLEAELPRPLSHTDALADEIVLAVRRGMEPVDLADMEVLGSLTNASRETLPLPGHISGNAAVLPLPAGAYAVPGPFTLTIQLRDGDVRHTLLRLTGQMARSTADRLISSGDLLPTMPELLQQISGMQEATADAIAAADEAHLAADLALSAPVIIAESEGETATITDAAARPARSVVTLLQPLREGEGTPAPDHILPILPRATAALFHAAARDEAATPIASAELPADVYLGEIDWVTGVLTVTHRNVLLAGTGAGWTYGSNNIALRLPDRAANATLYSDRYVTNSRSGPTGLAAGEMCLGKNYNNVCFGNPGNAITIDEWRAQRDESPIQLVYELASPTTVQLTPHQISLLKGDNALWSEGGWTRVVYAADTRLYIDQAVSAIAAGLLNT